MNRTLTVCDLIVLAVASISNAKGFLVEHLPILHDEWPIRLREKRLYHSSQTFSRYADWAWFSAELIVLLSLGYHQNRIGSFMCVSVFVCLFLCVCFYVFVCLFVCIYIICVVFIYEYINYISSLRNYRYF